MKIIIVGAGAGGATVAARARRLNEQAEIILIDAAADISQATCGLPYFVGDVIPDRDRMVVASAEDFVRLMNVDVRPNSEVIQLSRDARTVTVRELDSHREYTLNYDRLVLATGTSPFIPDLPGIVRNHVFPLKTLANADAIRAHLAARPCRHAVVIGGGLVGLEMAENLRRRGLEVTVIERAQQVLEMLDLEMAGQVQQHLQRKGIQLILEQEVSALTATQVLLSDGGMLQADIVILAMGVRPNNKLAAGSGLKLGPRGGIAVNADCTTSDPNIFALGDAIEVEDFTSGQSRLLPLAGPAQQQAMIVAENLFGMQRCRQPCSAASIVRVFDLTVASVGANEKMLRTTPVEYETCHVELPQHVAWYPGAMALTIKLLFTRDDGRLLGAQIVGTEGVDKRIDVIATALQFGKTVSDLAELNLAYAPPYSSARDPVNIAGQVARNMLAGLVTTIQWHELKQQLDTVDREDVLLDVRTPEEYDFSALAGSINIPLDALRQRLHELPRDRRIVVLCQTGKKSYFAVRLLRQHGFENVCNLDGGLKLYRVTEPSVGSEPGMLPNVISRRANRETVSGALLSAARVGRKAAHASANRNISLEIDATGLSCPGPILRLTHGIRRINDGEYLLIRASDPDFGKDIETWCRKTGNSLCSREASRSVVQVVIRKDGSVGPGPK